jgi:predicted porin
VAPSSITANVQLAYSSRPDYANSDVTTLIDQEQGAIGDSLMANAKIDYSYRWTQQFSTLTSISANTHLFESGGSDDGHTGFTVGNECRFRTGRFTWVGETRYEISRYSGSLNQDASTTFLLVGVEWTFGPWIQISTRVGESMRNASGGNDESSPHVEFAASFQPNPWDSFAFNAQYGLEANNLRPGVNKTFGAGLTYHRVLTTRLSASLSANYGRSESTGDDAGSVQKVVHGSFALSYQLTRRTSLSASVDCSKVDSQRGGRNQDHNRFVLSASHQF